MLIGLAALTLGAGCSSDPDDGGGSAEAVQLTAAGEQGRQVAEDEGCTSCHSSDGSDGVGPTWQGLAGSEVELDGGTTVIADDDYLTEAIVDPNAQLVKGFRGIMPERAIDADQVAAIVAYLNEIGADADSAG